VITVSRHCPARPESVWAVIADGWSYAAWVVGASRIRAVDRDFPALGSKVHHSVGSWPLLLSDETEVTRLEPGRLIRLQARTRPFGEAYVELEVTPEAGGSRIVMREDASHGPARFLPRPVRQLALVPRNAETTQRLSLLAQGREQQRASGRDVGTGGATP
jgi:uncharacterized protein YndB with AHSA1/START domain